MFRRGIGESSDVVGKEMYEFEDRDGTMLALRPEGTASVVRAYLQHRPVLPWKAWYLTPAFRHERPQAGRYRQHHQVGIEALGSADPDLDVEVIWLAERFFRSLGLVRLLAVGQLHGGRARAGPPTSSCSPSTCGPTGTSCATSTATASTPTRCGSSTASGRECRAVTEARPRT